MRYGWGESLPSAVWGTKWLQAAEGKEKLRTEDPDLPESTAGPRECSHSCTRSPALTGWGQTGRGGKERTQKLRVAPASPSRTEDPPLECTRRKKHIQLRSKSDVEPLFLSTGIVHVIPDPPHTAWPLLMGWKHSAKLVICTCRSGGPSGPKNKTKKAAEERPRPTHSPPHTRGSVCTNATFCFVRSIDKSNFGV